LVIAVFAAIIFAQLAAGGVEDTGEVASNLVAVTFATAAHNSIFTFLLGLPFERAMFWHKFFATASLVAGIYHGCLAGLGDEDKEQVATGLVACVTVGSLAATGAVEPLRRRAFQLWYYLHWLLFSGVVAALLLHDASGVLFGVGLWVFDVAFRTVGLAGFKHAHSATLDNFPEANVVRVTIPRSGSFHFRGGQYVFLCVPELSLFEWHPFSISGGDAETFTLHVKAVGDWTRRLQELAIRKKEDNKGGDSRIHILFEGPYGHPVVDLEGPTYSNFLLISGGIGVTPLLATAAQLLDQQKRGRKLDLCWFVWSCRDPELVEAVLPPPPPLSPSSSSPPRHTPASLLSSRLSSSPSLPTPDTTLSISSSSPLHPVLAPESPSSSSETATPPTSTPSRNDLVSSLWNNDLVSSLWNTTTANSVPEDGGYVQVVVEAVPEDDGCSEVVVEDVCKDTATAGAAAGAASSNGAGENEKVLPAGEQRSGESVSLFQAGPSCHCEVYMTRAKCEADLKTAMSSIRSEAHHALRHGRPDLMRVLATAAKAAEEKGQSRVAVMACGPAALLHDIAVLCDRHNNNKSGAPCGAAAVQLDLHVETFAL